MDGQLREGIRTGLVKVSFSSPIGPRDYRVTITNGSGTKTTVVRTAACSTAAGWAAEWAATEGPGWTVANVEGVTR